MNADAVTVDRVQLEQVFPCLRLLRSGRIACGFQVLLPSLLAVLLSDGLETAFGPAVESAVTVPGTISDSGGAALPAQPAVAALAPPLPAEAGGPAEAPVTAAIRSCCGFIPQPVRQLAADLDGWLRQGLLSNGQRWLRVVWNLMVLCLAGGSVSYACARSFSRQQRAGTLNSVRQAIRSGRAWLLSVVLAAVLLLFPWLLLAGCSGLIRLTGMATWLPDLTAAAVWSCGFLCAATAVVVGAGWLLGIAAVMADGCTGSDALSRGINYVLSHPLRSGGYAVVVLLSTGGFAELLSLLADYAVKLGDATAAVEMARLQTISSLLVRSYAFAVFFCGVTIAHLLLREREDAVVLAELARD